MVNQIPFRTSKSETSGAGPATPNPSFAPFFAASSFSHTYKSLFPAYPSISIFIFLIIMRLQIPQCANPLFSHLCKTPGVSPKEFDSIARVRSASLPQIHFFHTVAASCGLLALFFAFVSFIFNHLQPLVPKTGGGVGGAGRASVRPFQITYSSVKTLEREHGITR